MKQILRLYTICKKSHTSFWPVLIRTLFFKYRGKNIIAHRRARVKGLANISTGGVLKIGLEYRGFDDDTDVSLLNIRGKATFKGNFSIGRGCRLDIGDNGELIVGAGGYVNSNTLFVVMKRLTIGDNCSISWNCQFLDSDFHQIEYDGKSRTSEGIIAIGNHVWIGCNVKVYKNSFIADGCIVASDSVVKSEFRESNCLIAGNPAKIIKRNVSWK